MEKKILSLTFILLFALIEAQNLIPTAPTPGQPPPTTTISTDPTIPTAPTGGTEIPTDSPTPAPPPVGTEPPPTPGPTPVPTPAPPVPFECPPTGVHSFPDPISCQRFFTCINGNRFDGICQEGFLFDTSRGNCEPAGAVDCGDREN